VTGIQKKFSGLEKYIVIESGSDFKQDDWTCSFCEVFSTLRKSRIIPTNQIFADEIGLHQTGLSHVLRGRRNFPNDYRTKAEKLLLKYHNINGKILPYKSMNDFSIAAVTDTDSHDQVEASTIVTLSERRNRLCEEIDKLKKEWPKLRQEVDSLMSKLIILQSMIIEDLEE
jgi:hypothetical protein